MENVFFPPTRICSWITKSVLLSMLVGSISCLAHTLDVAVVVVNATGRRWVAGCEGDIPECFPTTPLSDRPVKRSGPTRVYRVPRILKTGGNRRHRCAQTPSTPLALDQTIGTRPRHTPPTQSKPGTDAPTALCLSPHCSHVHRCRYSRRSATSSKHLFSTWARLLRH